MGLREDLDRIAAAASKYASPGEKLAGIVPGEAEPGERSYLCAFQSGEERSWLVLDDEGRPVTDRDRIRRAVSIIAMSELAEESAGGGELEELRQQLVALRLSENPPGIEAAEEAALALERAIGAPPRIAEPAYLDRVGEATRRLEAALGPSAGSPFAEAMKQGLAAAEELTHDVLAGYKLPLDQA
jgi:hypothetical protein